MLLKNILLGNSVLVGLLATKAFLKEGYSLIYKHAMQESVIHHIAAAYSLSVHPVYHQFI